MGNKMPSKMSILKTKRNPTKVRMELISATAGNKVNEDENSYFTIESCSSKTEDHANIDGGMIIEDEKSIDAATFNCEICVDRKTVYDSFNPKGCTHFYCVECTVRYVASKLEDNLTSFTCPMAGCEGLLEPESCRDILPKDVFDWWGIALCESVIDGSKKFYCPYKDCSALLINDTRQDVERLDCPFCKRTFCVKCNVAWHSEITCAKFRKLKKKGEDAMLADLAKRKNWRKCPNCKFYVEKTFGCLYMKCRCGYAFCYHCGSRSSGTFHVCPRCKN